jgi:GNAT superfamily N-acetyltransferase
LLAGQRQGILPEKKFRTMICRRATLQDSESIARLHASSWQAHYRGILKEEFLNSQVHENRLQLWQSRLENPPPNQYVLVALQEDTLCGFACVYFKEDPLWGSLLDNLHVSADYKGQGIGTRLLKSAAFWACRQDPAIPFYLWVYAGNESARKFYERLGAVNTQTQVADNPDGGQAAVCRYVWRQVNQLVEPDF